MSEPWCDWCGRAIYQAKLQRSGLRWFAVKGVERGYDPLVCDANQEDGRHEPASECVPVTTVAGSTTDQSRAGNSSSEQVPDT